MIIVSEDNNRTVDIGSNDILFSIYSTIKTRLGLGKKG